MVETGQTGVLLGSSGSVEILGFQALFDRLEKITSIHLPVFTNFYSH